jgi:hypothetical protein
MMKPSRALNAQADSPLFKLAAETRNQIYELLFTIETNEYGDVELSKATAPSNALAGTCQKIYNESNAMFELAACDYPTKYNFVITVRSRENRVPISNFSSKFFYDINAFRVNWRADEHNGHNGGKPLHLTTYFRRYGDIRYKGHDLHVHVEVHDRFWTPRPGSGRRVFGVVRSSSFYAKTMMDMLYPFGCPSGGKSPSEAFASAVYKVAYPGPGEESVIWGASKAPSTA